MMGRQAGDQSQLFYLFNLEERIPPRHLRINPIVTRVVAELCEKLKPFYSDIVAASASSESCARRSSFTSRPHSKTSTSQMKGSHQEFCGWYPRACASAQCAHLSLDLLSLDMRLVMQNDIQQRTVDLDAAVVVNEAQFSKFVHEKTHAGPRRSDHIR
jgi:hypothetical protein